MNDSRKKPVPPEPEERAPEKPVNPAGPHAKPELTDHEATPGAGTLPDPAAEGDADAATG